MTDKPLPTIKYDPGAQERFERAVDAALHTKPMHRKAKPKAESKPAAADLQSRGGRKL